jgi:hypothetical protein
MANINDREYLFKAFKLLFRDNDFSKLKLWTVLSLERSWIKEGWDSYIFKVWDKTINLEIYDAELNEDQALEDLMRNFN